MSFNAPEFPNATMAAKASEEARTKPEDISHLLLIVRRAIERAAANGERSIGDPFAGLRMIVSDAQRARVIRFLNERGFTVRQQFDRNDAATIISW